MSPPLVCATVGALPSVTPERLLLALVLAGGLALRLVNVDYGLPFVWSLDEGTHFTSRAVLMFREGLDPGYYQNPPLFTELVHVLLRAMYGPLGAFFDLPAGNVVDDFERDPTEVWIAGRALIAVLCTGGAAAAFWAGRGLWGEREGLVAAALVAFAFLPVAYSRVAVSDAGSLAGVAVALYGCVRLAEVGGRRYVLLTGVAIGLAVSFKYTSGLLLLPLAIAAGCRIRDDNALSAMAVLAGAALVAGVVLMALSPALLLNFSEFRADLHSQAEITAIVPKPGQDGNALSHYLNSLGWGLGLAAGLAALAGAAVLGRRDWRRALILASFPAALLIYLSLQSRYFGRWLLPAYPALALLAAVALTRGAELARRPGARAAALVVLTLAAIAQPLAADLRTAAVLGRDDTRQQVRDYLRKTFPPELRVSVEPAVPGRWFRVDPTGEDPPWLERCPRRGGWTDRGWRYAAAGGPRVCRRSKPGQFTRPDGAIAATAYHLVVDEAVIDQYRRHGYCVIVTFGVVRDRAIATGSSGVREYYRRLERESRVLRVFSPYDRGAEPVPFDFDLSYNYEPAAYHRPGPLAVVYRLRGCRQAYGTPTIQIPRAPEPEPERLQAPAQGRGAAPDPAQPSADGLRRRAVGSAPLSRAP